MLRSYIDTAPVYDSVRLFVHVLEGVTPLVKCIVDAQFCATLTIPAAQLQCCWITGDLNWSAATDLVKERGVSCLISRTVIYGIHEHYQRLGLITESCLLLQRIFNKNSHFMAQGVHRCLSVYFHLTWLADYDEI